MSRHFSDRYGYGGPEPEITIREDFPAEYHHVLVQIAVAAGMSIRAVREIVCQVLFSEPDYSNHHDSQIRYEVLNHLAKCEWFKIYDIAEAIWRNLSEEVEQQDAFRDELNRFFRETGIGWKLDDNGIVFRGGEGFAETTHTAVEVLTESDRTTAANEVREALRDLSRRPEPDRTGAIQHSIAALEAVARDIVGEPRLTLGQLAGALDLPKPLDQAIEKLWGFASQHGRHLQEGKLPNDDEAELVVSVACAVCIFLSRRRSL